MPTMTHVNFNAGSSQRGVVLVEAMVAILIFSIGILAIVGLQATMLKDTTDSKFRADASFLAQQRVGLMWADPANIANYIESAPVAVPGLPNGFRTTNETVVGTGIQATVTITWKQAGEQQHTYTTVASIAGN
jgi:type IV pilus assembly protein PilV